MRMIGLSQRPLEVHQPGQVSTARYLLGRACESQRLTKYASVRSLQPSRIKIICLRCGQTARHSRRDGQPNKILSPNLHSLIWPTYFQPISMLNPLTQVNQELEVVHFKANHHEGINRVANMNFQPF